jgi:enediyne polyketide synthase
MMRQRLRPSAIAVIGLACRYPEAITPRQLWENILAQRRQFRRFPNCRLPLADYYDPDPTVPDKTYGRRAALIDGFDFDWSGRRIPVSTVRTTDLVHWLALETSLAAVADAGYSPADLPGERTGVIIGNSLTGEQTRAHTLRLRWPFVRRALHRAARAQGLDESQVDRLTQALKERYLAVFPPVDEDTLAGGLSNTIAGRICNYLNLMGGGFSVDGACASSLLAVAHAASRLVNRDLDLAIVGGVDISLDPFELVGFAKTGALTDGDMMVYDRGGKGFIPGEGCGFMVLKPLADARRDGNPVYAVLRGWGISSDGAGSGITAPSVSGQALALERAYQHSPFGISDLDFIEGHGTGTTVGDRVELEAIARVLGKAPLNGGEQRPCGITSLKSILGHTKAASGIGGLIKAVMAVNRRVVPPTAACHEPHPAFDHAARRLYPVRQGRRESATKQLRAGVSSMGFGGINCHVTIDSADPPDDRLKPLLDEVMLLAHPQESEVLLIGGGSQTEMLRKIGELIRVADGISMAELADLSAHLSRQLPPDPLVRAAIVTGHPDDLLARLAQLERSLRHTWPVGSTRPATSIGPDMWLGVGNTTPRIGFLFPGQGSQQINMARNLVQRFPWARSRLKQADRITRKLSGVRLSHRVFRDIDRAASSEEKQRWISVLSRTENAQPAICLASMLWLDYLSRLGVRPEAVGGHSLGELTACHAAGVFGAATLLEFAVRRGKAMADQAGVPGAMVSLQCDEATAIALIPRVHGYLTVANRNSPRQTVLSGESAAVEALVGMARENGISARVLPVSGAFHSRLSQDAAERVAAMGLLAKPLSAMACRFFSSVDGALLESGQPLSGHFSRQIRSRVDFIRLAEEMAACCDLILEVGPGRVLSGLAADVLGEAGPLCLPVTFQPSANLSRTIYFSNYIKWMGNTREASAWPVLAQMANQFASGRWGGVTNYGHLKILGEAGTSDRIEIRMWVSDNSGPEDATMTLSYDFRKILPDAGSQRLAFCRLQTTWVEILGPGLAKAAPYPAYYGQFIADMCPRFDAPDIPEPMPESLGHLFDVDDDPILFAAAAGPAALPVIREQIVDTTLSHANLVGNIYYANFYEWQGEIRDRFFYELIPDYFHGVGEKGELLALESRVDHLREAMPFDRILITLAVKEVRSCRVTLHVDYFRLEPDASPVKIAYGMHRAAWVTRDAQGRPTAAPFPGRVRAAFETMIHQSG